MGPLQGIRVLEFAGIGPGPFAAMLLADLGADVLRLDRIAPAQTIDAELPADFMLRGRRSVGLDLKHPSGVETALRLIEGADALIEGFRPGVMERLGLGPELCLARNPRLVFGRMTGWGQEGPLAQAAGHDINYIALSGSLAPLGRRGHKPTPPINLLGDFGGGGMLLALGILSALLERSGSGRGQVVDAAMVDGSALLMTMIHALHQAGAWREERGSNVIDTGAPFYDTYETADGKFVSVGALEPQFYALLLEKLGLAGEELPRQMDSAGWPALKERFEKLFKTRTRDEWCQLLEGSDACFAPVLEMREAPDHAHLKARQTFVEHAGTRQPAPAPRFSRTPARISRPAPEPGEHTDEALSDWGFSPAEIQTLRSDGAVG